MHKLLFHRDLYSLQAIEEVQELYSHLATIQISSEGEDIIVNLTDVHPGLADKLMDAFANHALHATIVHHQRDHKRAP